jgi:hypothetical protein
MSRGETKTEIISWFARPRTGPFGSAVQMIV